MLLDLRRLADGSMVIDLFVLLAICSERKQHVCDFGSASLEVAPSPRARPQTILCEHQGDLGLQARLYLLVSGPKRTRFLRVPVLTRHDPGL